MLSDKKIDLLIEEVIQEMFGKKDKYDPNNDNFSNEYGQKFPEWLTNSYDFKKSVEYAKRALKFFKNWERLSIMGENEITPKNIDSVAFYLANFEKRRKVHSKELDKALKHNQRLQSQASKLRKNADGKLLGGVDDDLKSGLNKLTGTLSTLRYALGYSGDFYKAVAKYVESGQNIDFETVAPKIMRYAETWFEHIEEKVYAEAAESLNHVLSLIGGGSGEISTNDLSNDGNTSNTEALHPKQIQHIIKALQSMGYKVSK